MNTVTLLALLDLADRAPKTKTEVVWLMTTKAELEREIAAEEAANLPPETPPNANP